MTPNYMNRSWNWLYIVMCVKLSSVIVRITGYSRKSGDYLGMCDISWRYLWINYLTLSMLDYFACVCHFNISVQCRLNRYRYWNTRSSRSGIICRWMLSDATLAVNGSSMRGSYQCCWWQHQILRFCNLSLCFWNWPLVCVYALCYAIWRFIVFLLLYHVVSWVRCGTSLYRFLIFAVFLTLIAMSWVMNNSLLMPNFVAF